MEDESGPKPLGAANAAVALKNELGGVVTWKLSDVAAIGDGHGETVTIRILMKWATCAKCQGKFAVPRDCNPAPLCRDCGEAANKLFTEGAIKD